MKFLQSDICTLLHVQVFVRVNHYLLVSRFTRSGKQQLIQFYCNTLFVFTAEVSVNVLYEAHPPQGHSTACCASTGYCGRLEIQFERRGGPIGLPT